MHPLWWGNFSYTNIDIIPAQIKHATCSYYTKIHENRRNDIFPPRFPFWPTVGRDVTVRLSDGGYLVIWLLIRILFIHNLLRGRRLLGISGSLIWSKTLMEPLFNHSSEFRWSPEGPVSQIHSPHLHVGAPGILSDLLRSVQMPKREWGAESNGKQPHLSIPNETAAWVPEFAVEDLPLTRTEALVPEFAVKDLPLGRILMMIIYCSDSSVKKQSHYVIA